MVQINLVYFSLVQVIQTNILVAALQIWYRIIRSTLDNSSPWYKWYNHPTILVAALVQTNLVFLGSLIPQVQPTISGTPGISLVENPATSTSTCTSTGLNFGTTQLWCTRHLLNHLPSKLCHKSTPLQSFSCLDPCLCCTTLIIIIITITIILIFITILVMMQTAVSQKFPSCVFCFAVSHRHCCYCLVSLLSLSSSSLASSSLFL